MANNFGTGVWSIDTVFTSGQDAATGVLKGVRWVGATTAGHAVTITDKAGRTLWASVASAANYVEADAPNVPFVGLRVPTLGSGTLYLDFG